MPQKIIIDLAPGLGEALVLCLALFEPEVEVVALTSAGGKLSVQTAARNLRGLVEYLDPPKFPRIGFGEDPEERLPQVDPMFCGLNDLCGFSLPVADRCTPPPADKLIVDYIRKNPTEVSILALGPLTNIMRAFQRDPEIPMLLKRLYICGGTYLCPGNVSPVAEFNMFCDPKSAQYVFRSQCSKTLIPLDVAYQYACSLQILEKLPSSESRFGALLHHLFVSLFRFNRQHYGLESIRLHELLAWYAMLTPTLFETVYEACDVETIGLITLGETVFDRRSHKSWRQNVEVFHQIHDPELFTERMLASLDRIDKQISK